MGQQASINDQTYEIHPGETIYQFVSRQLGKGEIPTLCHHSALEPFGACRLCIVEVAFEDKPQSPAQVVASCHTPVVAGQKIYSKTARLEKIRKNILEMLASDFPARKMVAEEGHHDNRLQKLFQRYEVTNARFPARLKEQEQDDSHPYLRFDSAQCINCYLCIRSCDEIQGSFVLSMFGRGYQNKIIKSNLDSFIESECVSCGACVQHCPTGALTDIYQGKTLKVDKSVRTICTYCGVGCNLDVLVKEGEIKAINTPEDAAVNRGHSCVKGRYSFSFHNHPDRLREPLLKKNGTLQPVSWEEALNTIASRLTELKETYGADAIGGISSSRCTNEENYLMQKFMRVVIGSNNIDGCARVCHAPTAYGMQQTLGTGAATNSIDELLLTDCILVIGSNTTEAHPVTGARIKQRAMKGIPLIVIDPRKTELARFADVHLQLRPGTNVALLNMMLHAIVDLGLVDRQYIEERTEGFETFAEKIREIDLELMQKIADVPYQQAQQAAKLYAEADQAMCFHGLGVTEHFQGSKTVMLIVQLAMITGNLGKPGCGINPLRGQNNVQGAADMGVQPNQGAGYLDITDPAVREHYRKIYGVEVPAKPGLKTPEMFAAARMGELKAMWVMGEDMLQTDPNSTEVRRCLSSLDFLVVQELFMTETAALADVVLPAASFFEKNGTFTNGERRVQRVNQVIPPLSGCKSDGQIVIEVMQRMGYSQPDYNAEQLLKEISQAVPFFSGINWQNLGQNGLQWPVDMAGRDTQILHVGSIKRGKGLFKFFPFSVSPELLENSKQFPFILTTGRILEHYNCGSMTRRSLNSVLIDKDYLLIHPDDAAAYQISDGTTVEIESAWGKTHIRAKLTRQVKPGVLYTTFHFPEVAINHITSNVMDEESKTPEFKVVAVRIKTVPDQDQTAKAMPVPASER